MCKHTKQRLLAAVCILLGVLLGAGGIWVGDTDDASRRGLSRAGADGSAVPIQLPPPAPPAQKVLSPFTSAPHHSFADLEESPLVKFFKKMIDTARSLWYSN